MSSCHRKQNYFSLKRIWFTHWLKPLRTPIHLHTVYFTGFTELAPVAICLPNNQLMDQCSKLQTSMSQAELIDSPFKGCFSDGLHLTRFGAMLPCSLLQPLYCGKFSQSELSAASIKWQFLLPRNCFMSTVLLSKLNLWLVIQGSLALISSSHGD